MEKVVAVGNTLEQLDIRRDGSVFVRFVRWAGKLWIALVPNGCELISVEMYGRWGGEGRGERDRGKVRPSFTGAPFIRDE